MIKIISHSKRGSVIIKGKKGNSFSFSRFKSLSHQDTMDVSFMEMARQKPIVWKHYEEPFYMRK